MRVRDLRAVRMCVRVRVHGMRGVRMRVRARAGVRVAAVGVWACGRAGVRVCVCVRACLCVILWRFTHATAFT